MQDCHNELDTTFQELVDRTSVMTALYGVAFTVAGRAHSQKDPHAALELFKSMLDDSFNAIKISMEKGEWKPPSATASK
jgi:hypothetical protein